MENSGIYYTQYDGKIPLINTVRVQQKIMEQDQIKEIGIDNKGRLYVKPLSKEFPFIYREALEVHWDSKRKFLYSPKPREWNYLDWFKQIINAAKAQSCSLAIAENTTWVNIPNNLKAGINNEY